LRRQKREEVGAGISIFGMMLEKGGKLTGVGKILIERISPPRL
jgi:hypothetical protein